MSLTILSGAEKRLHIASQYDEESFAESKGVD